MVVIEARAARLCPVHGVHTDCRMTEGGGGFSLCEDRPQILVARPGQKGGQLPGEVFDALAGAEGVPENLLGR